MTQHQQLADKLTQAGNLKSCGCGSKEASIMWEVKNGEPANYVKCEGCGFTLDETFKTEQEAIAAWNQLKCAQ